MGEKHTPGPWRIAGKGTIRAGDLHWVAGIHWQNREANARLIAAAPDLLAACHGMVELLSGKPMSGIEGEQRLQAALTAIAKATPTDTKPAGEGVGA